jgi:DNA polymerase-3 subunit chi
MRDKLDISFYHFTITPLVIGLPRLIKKIYSTKQNLFVLCKTEEEMIELNKVLWTFSSKEFIPHGTINEADPELQPVLLSTDPSHNRNASTILLSTTGETTALDPSFSKHLYSFYGNQDEVKPMADLYQTYRKRDDIAALFWRQDQAGKWNNVV